jgi:hypothetical protein
MRRVLIVMATVLALVLTSFCSAAVFTPSSAAHAAPEPVNTPGSPYCDAAINTDFAPCCPVTYTVTTYSHYSAGDQSWEITDMTRAFYCGCSHLPGQPMPHCWYEPPRPVTRSSLVTRNG